MTLEKYITDNVDDFLDGDDEDCDDSFLDECNADGVPEYDEVEECGDDLSECDAVPEYDEVEEDDELVESKKPVSKKRLNEKKTGCCPKKKSKGETITLSEALGKTRPVRQKTPTLDELIDSICGKKVNEDIQKKAMQKVLAESEQSDKITFLRAKLGEKKFTALMESLQDGRKSMSDFRVNGKHISEFSTNEIEAILEKVNGLIKKYEEQLASEGLNEADTATITKNLELRRILAEKLSDELDYRNAIKEAEEDAPMDPFGNVDSVPSGEETPSDNSTEDENPTDEEENKDDEKNPDEKNPDEDETIELSQIVITLASKDAAEDLNNDLIDAGIPEDVLKVEKASDDEDEEENPDEEQPAEGDEKPADEEQPAEEKAEESVKADGKKLNEADDEEKPADEEQPADSEEKPANDEDNADEPYKVILTDTEYVEILANVLQDIWGMDNDEFNELIGGEIVSDTENEEDKDDEGGSDKSSEDNTEDDGDEEISAEDIFKGL